ncbi:hypothetical protein RUND412_002708 [Rhizina undulata]
MSRLLLQQAKKRSEGVGSSRVVEAHVPLPVLLIIDQYEKYVSTDPSCPQATAHSTRTFSGPLQSPPLTKLSQWIQVIDWLPTRSWNGVAECHREEIGAGVESTHGTVVPNTTGKKLVLELNPHMEREPGMNNAAIESSSTMAQSNNKSTEAQYEEYYFNVIQGKLKASIEEREETFADSLRHNIAPRDYQTPSGILED